MTPPAAHLDGYVTDVAYPDYFHREIMPVWLCSTLQALGRRTPDLQQPYTWLELGCGTGISTVIAAATNPQGQFIGLDFNPDAIAQAQALAQAVGVPNVRFVCQSFEAALAADADALPPCDFIVSHGVYSWISTSNRAALRQLLERHLRPGGVLYLAYMSQPGSASMAAAQKLVHLATHDMAGSSTDKADAGLALLQQMAEAGTGYCTEHPRIATELGQLRGMDRRYTAHEFLNAHWESLHVADVMADLAQTGCDYAGSATLLENIDGASLPEQSLPLLNRLRQQGSSVAAQETFKDIARNQNQRRDLYQRPHPQGNALSADAHRHALLSQRIALLPAAPSLQAPLPAAFTLDTRIGPVQMPMAHVAPLLAALQNGPQSYAQLVQLPLYAQQPGAVSQLLQLLAWVGWVQFVRPDWQADACLAPATSAMLERLNAALALRPCGQPAVHYQAHAAAGSAIPMP